MWKRSVLVAGVVVACGWLGGCFTYRAGELTDADVKPFDVEQWPSRDMEAVKSFCDSTPDRIFRYALQPGVAIEDVNPAYAPSVHEIPDFTIHATLTTSHGLARLFTDHREFEASDIDQVLWGFTPNAAFLSCHEVRKPAFTQRMAELEEGPDSSERMLAYFAPGLTLPRTAQRVALTQGVAMHVPLELDAKAHGILIHFTAMFGNEYEQRVLEVLRRRGWVVLSISTEYGIDPPPPVRSAELSKLLERRDSARVALRSVSLRRMDSTDPEETAALQTEERQLRSQWIALVQEAAIATRGSFQVCSEADVDPVAAEIARAIDEVLAENAYAADAALALAVEKHPELADVPVAVIGFSAGSLAAPAAAVRLGDRLCAIVLVGGGSNLLSIGMHSAFSDAGVRVLCNDSPVSSAMALRLSEAYLQYSRLDPHHLAAYLRHIPVLHVRATHDAWIPARNARDLARRLGSPDRLTHFGGHRSLFYFLPSQAVRIGRWLDRQLPDAPLQ